MSEATATRAELDKGYEPAKVEAHWAAWWEEQGFFRSQDESDKPPFSIVMPPPNVTGSLHIGHALTATIQDVLARWKRMSGFNALLAARHRSRRHRHADGGGARAAEAREEARHDLGREEFLSASGRGRRSPAAASASSTAPSAPRWTGTAQRFTMDEQSSRAVREAFVRLYEEGLHLPRASG